MPPVTPSADAFDELRAPEVVKVPTSAGKPDRKVVNANRPPDNPPARAPGANPRPPPPLPQAARTGNPNPNQQPTPSPPPLPKARERPPEKQPSPLRQSRSTPASSQNPDQSKALLIGLAVVIGIIMLVYYAASTDQAQQATQLSQTTYTPEPVRPQPPSTQEPLQSQRISPATAHPKQEPAGTDAQPGATAPEQERGSLQLSAYATTADGEKHAVTGPAVAKVYDDSWNAIIATNVRMPCVVSGLPVGEYRLLLVIQGHNAHAVPVNLQPKTRTAVAIALQPLPVQVQFAVPADARVVRVYKGSDLLGDSTGPIALEPFTMHILTFKAPGWRDKVAKVRFPDAGTTYRCPVTMEQVQAFLHVTVSSRKGKAPTRGALTINGEAPRAMSFPFEGRTHDFIGPTVFALNIDGYTVLGSPQTVDVVDGEITEVSFQVERKSLVSRLFSSDAQ